MEFNTGIYPFTGTSKSPLNMFQLRDLTILGSRNSAAEAEATASRTVFSCDFKGLSRLKLSLTRRQGDFAEYYSEEMGRTSQGG